MIKFLLTATLVLSLFFDSNAQIEITLGDMPIADTSYNVYYRMVKSSDLADINPGTASENFSWDFSGLSNGKKDSSIFLDPGTFNDTVVKYFLESNIAELTDGATTFYSMADVNNKTFVKLLGVSDTAIKKFTTQLIKLDLPLTYKKSTAPIGIDTVHIGPNTRLQEIVSQKNLVDAWGTIKTPYKNYEALRIYSLISTTKNNQSYANGTWSTKSKTVDTSKVYSWWAKGIGKEVFKITYTGAGGNTLSEVSWFSGKKPLVVTSNLNTLSEAEIMLGPNPSNGNIVLSLGANDPQGFRLSVLDLLGKEKHSSAIPGNISNFNFSSLPDGIYLFKITSGDGRSLIKKVTFKN